MQKGITAITTLLFITLGVLTVTFESCKKSDTNYVSTSYVSFKNNTFTTVTVTLDGVLKTVAPGSTVSYSGIAGSTVVGSAYTCGRTSGGTQIGEMIEWAPFNEVFPTSSGDIKTEPLNVKSSIFFLYLKNLSVIPWSVVYVNYGLTAQTTDNITIPADGVTYAVGYYSAYTNSNVRTEDINHASYWQWESSDMGLPFTTNQWTTLTGY